MLNPYQPLLFIAQIIFAEEHNLYGSLAAQDFAAETTLVPIKWEHYNCLHFMKKECKIITAVKLMKKC
jgi:hypothetical protein